MMILQNLKSRLKFLVSTVLSTLNYDENLKLKINGKIPEINELDIIKVTENWKQ